MIVPFAVMFSLIGMRALGIALEQVSIAAIIIALGLLVDNGVVIVEDIIEPDRSRARRRGRRRWRPGEQYAFPLLVSSITTIAAFLPAVPAVGSVRRICVLAGRRRGPDPRAARGSPRSTFFPR